MSASEKASPHVNPGFDPKGPLDPSRALVPHVMRLNEQRVVRGFWPKMRKVAAQILDEIVAIKGIDSPDKLVGSLSGGQKQAVAIARAVHFNRTLLVLDEPTSALAARATQALFEYLRALRAKGLSSVLVTHDLYDAYRICDRFVVMSHGQIAMQARREDTSIEELIEKVSLS